MPCVVKRYDISKVFDIEFVIVEENLQPLLGLKACIQLRLIKRVDTFDDFPKSKDELIEKYRNVFEGLGAMKGYCYQIKLHDCAQPVVQPSRRIPFSLKTKLKDSLDQLVRSKIISSVDYPTEWVNQMIAIEKPNGKLRICLDPRNLNKFIMREHFLIPKSEDIISQLAGKQIFSVLDMKNGFWQIALEEESSKLCTFSTPFGRYKFNVLPFGISSAPEVFQRKNMEIFGDIQNVEVYFDDIIVSGKDEFEHDIALRKVLDRAIKYQLKFNVEKIQ